MAIEDLEIEELANLTEGFSGSDIMDICQSVQLVVNSEFFESGMLRSQMQPRAINMQDFLETIKRRN